MADPQRWAHLPPKEQQRLVAEAALAEESKEPIMALLVDIHPNKMATIAIGGHLGLKKTVVVKSLHILRDEGRVATSRTDRQRKWWASDNEMKEREKARLILEWENSGKAHKPIVSSGCRVTSV